MTDRISLDKFCDILSKMNMDFTDFVLEDWESIEDGNTKLDGMTEINVMLRDRQQGI